MHSLIDSKGVVYEYKSDQWFVMLGFVDADINISIMFLYWDFDRNIHHKRVSFGGTYDFLDFC